MGKSAKEMKQQLSEWKSESSSRRVAKQMTGTSSITQPVSLPWRLLHGQCPAASPENKSNWFHSFDSFPTDFSFSQNWKLVKWMSVSISTWNTRKACGSANQHFFRIVYGMLEKMGICLESYLCWDYLKRLMFCKNISTCILHFI